MRVYTKKTKTALTDAKSKETPRISDLSGNKAEQQSLLDGPNSHQYPAERKSSKDKQDKGGKSYERELWIDDFGGDMLEYLDKSYR